MMLTEVFNPLSIAELAACLPMLEPGAVIAGGCTDLSVRFVKTALPSQLLNVGLVRELKKIFVEDDCLHIGAAATFTELEEYPMPDGFTALWQAASGVGSKQIRNAATIGGNVMNASPAGDILPCLFLFGAKAEYMKPDGSLHERPIEQTTIDSGKTSLNYNEVLTAIKLPISPAAGRHSAFIKLGFRKKVTISRISIAMSAQITGGKAGDIRFLMGAVAPVPVRLYEAERILAENEWDAGTAEKLTAYLSDMLKQTVPAEFDRDYKMYAVKGAVYDILHMFQKP